MNPEERIARAAYLTRVVRHPKKHLATFGESKLDFYVVTEPTYVELWPDQEAESVIRQGTVTASRPSLVTPHYMLNLEGFSKDAYRYLDAMAHRYGPNSPGILYQYKSEPRKMEIVSGAVFDVANRVARDLDTQDEDNAVVITGVDDLWDVSLFKFIYDYTSSSTVSNAREMGAMGLLQSVPDLGVPVGVVQRIDELFQQVKQGLDPGVLHRELVRWGLFKVYEARFFSLIGNQQTS